MAVSDWSTTAASNTSVGGVNIAEGWSAPNANNAIRGLMAEVAASRASAPINLNETAACDGSTDDTTALNNAITALGSTGGVITFRGTVKVTAQITLSARVHLVGVGCTSDNTTRGASCILRAFTGTNPTILASGDDCGVSGIDIDNDSQGTGECLQITGTRVTFDTLSVRKSGGVGLRIGKTDSGASTINANLWRGSHLIALNNASHGLFIEHTNTDTSANYPAGVPDVNGGMLTHADLRSNGGDGIRLGNCIDNTFANIVCQSNTGYGFRFRQYARGHSILKCYTESNTAGDGILDSGATQNMILGNRAVTLTSGWTDNGSGNYLLLWHSDLDNDGWYIGGGVHNIVNFAAGGTPLLDFYADTSSIKAAAIEARQTTGSGGGLRIYTKRDGNTPVSRFEVDEAGNVWVPSANGVLRLSSATGPQLRSGTGTPEAVVTGNVGDIFLRTDGSTLTTLYVKTSGTGNTGWTAK